MLKSLKLTNVGPISNMEMAFGNRLNLVTGDNGLGKSFLLDIAWWC
jgi:DNA repair ATPase RecN